MWAFFGGLSARRFHVKGSASIALVEPRRHRRACAGSALSAIGRTGPAWRSMSHHMTSTSSAISRHHALESVNCPGPREAASRRWCRHALLAISPAPDADLYRAALTDFGADLGERDDTDTLARRVGCDRNRCARAGHRVRGRHPVPNRVHKIQVQGEERGGDNSMERSTRRRAAVSRTARCELYRKKSGNTDTTNLYSDPSFENGLHPFDGIYGRRRGARRRRTRARTRWTSAATATLATRRRIGSPLRPGRRTQRARISTTRRPAPGNFRVSFNWHDASGAEIGSSVGGGFGVPRNTWTRVYQDNAIAPAGATQAQLKWEAIQVAGVFMDEVNVREGPGFKVVDDRTNSKGKFKIGLGSGPPVQGKYYAKVKRTKIGSSNSKKTCLGRRSGSVKVIG